MPFAESHGRRIYYERHGEGPPVFFCHGAGSNAATWWQQLPAFAARHTCITMDIRCFGRSVAPLSEFTLPLFTDDVLAVLQHAGLERVAFIGQSLGGMIGLRLALTQPQRVAAFVACDTSLAIDHTELLAIVEKRMRTVRAVSIEQRSLGAWFLEHQPALAALYAQINHFNPSAHTHSAADWGAAMQGLLTPDALTPMDALPTLACPTLLLVGSEDPIVPVHVMREVSALVPGSEVHVVERAGHSAYFEMAQEFNTQVLHFLARRAHY